MLKIEIVNGKLHEEVEGTNIEIVSELCTVIEATIKYMVKDNPPPKGCGTMLKSLLIDVVNYAVEEGLK